MGFKDWWNTPYYPKQNAKHSTTNLMQYKTLIRIPKRKEFRNNIEIISRINEYKKKYRELLSTDKTIISKHLSFGDFYEELRSNTSLLLNLIVKHETDDIEQLDQIQTERNKQLRKELNSLKLVLYENRINEMELEAKIRGIALKEVYYERLLFLSSNKISAIEEELYSLTIQINSIYHQKVAIKKEKDAYEREIETTEIKERISPQEIENEAKIKLKSLYSKASILIPDIVKEVINRNESSLSKLAYLERMLEIYVYNHKDEVKTLDERINRINKLIDNNVSKSNLLLYMQNLERKYLIFYRYGENIVTKEQLKELYRTKFRILSINLIYDDNPFLHLSPVEEECYKEIIGEKIECIIKGENNEVQMIFANDAKEAIIEISEFLKEDTKGYDVDYILKHNFLALNLILAFDKELGLEDYFNNFKIFVYDEEAYDLVHPYINFESSIPLDTYYRLLACYKKYFLSAHPKNIFTENHMLNIYELMKKNIKDLSDTYRLPEGITSIDLTNISIGKGRGRFALIIQNKMYRESTADKTIVFPKSLKRLNGNFLHEYGRYVVLNDGLEELGGGFGRSLDKITIPASLKSFDIKLVPFINKPYIKKIYFKDYIHSQILISVELLANFIRQIFKYEIIDAKIAIRKEGTMFVGDNTIYTLKLTPLISTLGFIDEDGIESILDLEDFEVGVEKVKKVANLENETILSDSDIEEIIKKLYKLLGFRYDNVYLSRKVVVK